ncbi:MAG: 2OG-Fe(II) oxygenase [Rhodomicrobium sp.]
MASCAAADAGESMLNLAALERIPAYASPFPFVIVPNFVDEHALDLVEKDYPSISQPGSFPLETLRSGPAFSEFMRELREPRFRDLMGNKLGIDLKRRPTTITVRGRAREKDGQIHLDSKSKLVTVLIYMNGMWEADGGRLRLLNSPTDLDDMVMEVPPARGTLLAFLNTKNAWHGHKSFCGERKVIQLNWVRDNWVVWREKTRHSASAFFKEWTS